MTPAQSVTMAALRMAEVVFLAAVRRCLAAGCEPQAIGDEVCLTVREAGVVLDGGK